MIASVLSFSLIAPLSTGFTAYWPGLPSMPGCTMAVYGNGDIYLYTSGPDYVSLPSISNNVPFPGTTTDWYDFYACATDPYPGISIM
jgi:hypothetical protein